MSHCANGHEFTATNAYQRKDNGGLRCRTCVNARERAKRAANPKPRKVRACPAPKTHCKRGHEYTPENTHMWGHARMCRTCPGVRPRKVKSHCNRGHELTPENIADAKRRCRTCKNDRQTARYWRTPDESRRASNEQSHIWRSKHLELARARRRAQYANDPEKYKRWAREQKWGDPDLAEAARLVHLLRMEVRNHV